MPLAIVIEPYSMDCLNESYSKSEQNHISQAMFLFYSLIVFHKFVRDYHEELRDHLYQFIVVIDFLCDVELPSRK